MLRRPKEIVTASNVPSANGRFIASPATLGSRKPSLAADSMPIEKSVATHQAPVAESALVDTPVPAATSSTFCPGSNCKARTECRRQRASWPAERMVFVRS